MRVIRCIAAAAFLFASSAHAALISVTADIAWYAVPFEGVVIPERGTMNFVYDTAVPDSDLSPTAGRYDGAIISFVMTVEQQNRPDLFFTLTPGPTSITVSSFSDTLVQISLTATEQSGAYGAGSNMAFLGGVGWLNKPFGDALPSVADWISPLKVAAPASLGPALEHDWATNWRAVTLVPSAGTAHLLAAGALSLLVSGLMRRRVARIENRQR